MHVQACAWIESCEVEGCSSSCIMNTDKMQNFEMLLDREVREDSFQLCPRLAKMVHVAANIDRNKTSSRKLLQVRRTPSWKLLHVGAQIWPSASMQVQYRRRARAKLVWLLCLLPAHCSDLAGACTMALQWTPQEAYWSAHSRSAITHTCTMQQNLLCSSDEQGSQ
jgi:hypothetical protein